MSFDAEIAAADKEARRARIMSWIWWVQLPIAGLAFWLTSKEPIATRAMLLYLACVSIIANAVSYAGKAQAAEAKKAGYQNPRED